MSEGLFVYQAVAEDRDPSSRREVQALGIFLNQDSAKAAVLAYVPFGMESSQCAWVEYSFQDMPQYIRDQSGAESGVAFRLNGTEWMGAVFKVALQGGAEGTSWKELVEELKHGAQKARDERDEARRQRDEWRAACRMFQKDLDGLEEND